MKKLMILALMTMMSQNVFAARVQLEGCPQNNGGLCCCDQNSNGTVSNCTNGRCQSAVLAPSSNGVLTVPAPVKTVAPVKAPVKATLKK